MDTPSSQSNLLPQQPKKTFTPKFIAVIVVLLVAGLGAAAGIWYWQTSQAPKSIELPVHKEKDPMAGWKTYANSQYGFQFKMPSEYYFSEDLVLKPDGSSGFSAQMEALNKGIDSNKARGVLLSITSFAKSPKTIKEACEEVPVNRCSSVRNVSQEEILDLSSKLNSAKTGDTLSQLTDSGIFAQPGQVILLDGQKAIFQFDLNLQAEGYHSYLYWVDKENNLFNLHEFIPGNTSEEAKASQENKDFNQILASFKFTASPSSSINSFKKCADAGYPILESFPEQCKTPDGITFVKLSQPCVQVITPAKNPKTGEVRDFPTPCDVPLGWEKVSATAQ